MLFLQTFPCLNYWLTVRITSLQQTQKINSMLTTVQVQGTDYNPREEKGYRYRKLDFFFLILSIYLRKMILINLQFDEEKNKT